MEYAEVAFSSYDESVREALEQIGAPGVIAEQETVLVKPNLVNDSPPPVTTPAACTAAVVRLVREWSGAAVTVAEGCGAADRDTPAVFAALGYDAMAAALGVALLDLNTAETVRLENPDCTVFGEFFLPAAAMESFIISVPVLKAHSFSAITGSMKNMIGFAPPSRYQQGGHWKKSAFHARMHEAIADLNRYRTPDLTVMDASVGLADFHLGGPACDPPLNRVMAGFDAKAVDRRGAELLGLDWRRIKHLV